MKQKLLLLLTALMLLVTGNAWADRVYFNDFNTGSGTTAPTGLTIHGDGTFVDEGDANFGMVFQNGGGAQRTHYLQLPADVLSYSASSKKMTIGFWVNKGNAGASDTYLWAPLFTAYGDAPSNNANTGPMLACQYRGVLQVNNSGWCDYVDCQNVNGVNALYHGDTDWLADDGWHYYTVVFDNEIASVYFDGVLKNQWNVAKDYWKLNHDPWTIVDTDPEDSENYDHCVTTQAGLYSNGGDLDYVCLGGNQAWNWGDNDAAFKFDDFAVYDEALSAAQIQKIIFDKDPAAYIASKKGDLTSIINGDFQVDASGWTGGGWVNAEDVYPRSWRGTSYVNKFYEANYTSNMEYVLSNMPAGTYKVVAAARAWDGTITAKLNGTIGTHYDGIGDLETLDGSEINLNGVQMPYSNLGGFTTNAWGHNWRWIYATATLAEAGTLTITFNAQSNSIDWRWMCIDDVYLYCTKLGETDYTKTVRDNTTAFNPAVKVATADIIFENPNTVLRTSSNYITTAAGEPMNNDQYGSNKMTKLVLYDGHEFSYNLNNVAADNGAILYRSIPKDTWCTLVVPFVPTTALTKKVPSELSAGTLSFTDAVSANDEPMLIMSDTELTKIEGTRSGASGDMTSGVGAPMVGTYSDIDDLSAVSGTNYVVGTDGKLHKVTGAVTVAPFRAYFNIAESEARNVISMNFDGGYTGINAVEATEAEAGALKDGKYLIEGKIVLVKNGVKYGANGQKLN